MHEIIEKQTDAFLERLPVELTSTTLEHNVRTDPRGYIKALLRSTLQETVLATIERVREAYIAEDYQCGEHKRFLSSLTRIEEETKR